MICMSLHADHHFVRESRFSFCHEHSKNFKGRLPPFFFTISSHQIFAAQSSLLADYVYSDPKRSQLLHIHVLHRLVLRTHWRRKWTTPRCNSLHHTLPPQNARNAPQNTRIVTAYSASLTKLVVSVSCYGDSKTNDSSGNLLNEVLHGEKWVASSFAVYRR